MKSSHRFFWIAALLALTPASVWALDWTRVEARDLILFYPGQASWEWALTPSDHSGAKKFREGKNCRECHDGEEPAMGDLIASGRKLEPDPVEGKRGWIPLKVQVAREGERLYLRLEWPDGDQNVGRKLDPDAEVKVTVMLEDGHTVEALRAGCWAACHDDMIGMPSAPEAREITKYLVASRIGISRQGGGENFRSQAELDKLLNQGQFYEYWHAELNRGQEPRVSDGYILARYQPNPVPAVTVEATHKAGRWVALFSRQLEPGDPYHKDIVAGKTYFIGFAIHDAYAARRYHHVSLEHTLVLDQGEADFVATQQ
ncbi:ethylbenzene dehydrogenase-related protein [Marinobacterium aestuariivivens]|uniref:Ethylbenzene dehydrogenase-related protein n=1 Tax=Marinobacterium aestuariivivens TaxID=1698799 RepID=A0ABW2A859_9GAMM